MTYLWNSCLIVKPNLAESYLNVGSLAGVRRTNEPTAHYHSLSRSTSISRPQEKNKQNKEADSIHDNSTDPSIARDFSTVGNEYQADQS